MGVVDVAPSSAYSAAQPTPSRQNRRVVPYRQRPGNYRPDANRDLLLARPRPFAMGVAAYVIPMSVLAAVVVVGVIAIFWWFPRTYKKGVRADDNEVNQATGADREAQRQANRDIIERFKRARAIERGEVVDARDDIELAAPPPAYDAPPPVYAAKLPRAEVDHV